jgi:hypothetical protein
VSFDAGSIDAKLTINPAQFDRTLARAKADVKKFEDAGHKVKISAVFDQSSLTRARKMFSDLDNAISKDAMNRLRSSPQGSVLGSLNALFSPHPVTGAPSPSQAAQGGLLGKMINAPGGGTNSAGGRGGGSPLATALTQNVTTNDNIRRNLTGPAPGNVVTTDTITRAITGARPGDIKTTDTIKEKLDPDSVDKLVKDSGDSGDRSGRSFTKSFSAHLAGLFAGFGGKAGGGTKGTKGGAGGNPLDSGLLGGIGPGILGISTKMAGITAGVGSLIGALPALAAGVAALGVAGAGIGAAALIAKSSLAPASGLASQMSAAQAAAQAASTPAQAKAAAAQIASINAQVSQLSPALKSAYQSLVQIKNTWQSFAASFAPLFAPVLHQVATLFTSLLPTLRTFFTQAATLAAPLVGGLGDLARMVLPGLGKAFAAVAPLLRPMIDGIGGLVSGILPGLVTMLKAAAPAVSVLFKGLGIIGRGLGQMFTAFAPAVKASAIILNSLLSVVSALFPVIGSLAATFATALAPAFSAFAVIIKALLPVFRLIGGIIAQFAGAVIGDLSAAFGAVATLLQAIGPSLGVFAKAIGSAFAVLENTGVFAILGNAIESLAAPLGKMINALLKGLTPLLPPLIGFLSQVVTILAAGLAGALLAVIPPLTTLGVKVLGAIASVLPVVLPLLTTLLGLFTGAVVAVIGSVATALSAIINAIPPAMLTGLVLAFLAIAGAVKLWAIAQGILDIALNANPIGLVILAVAALAIGITELVTHWSAVWGEIKRIAEDAWSFLTHGWGQWIFPELTLIRLAVELVRDHWRQAWSDIKAAGADAWRFIDDMLHNKIFNALLAVAAPLAFLALHWRTTWAVARAVAQDFVNWFWNDFGAKIAVFLTQTIPGWFGQLEGAVKNTFNSIVSWVRGVPGKILGALGNAEQLLLNWGSGVINGLLNGFTGVIDSVWNFIKGIPGKILHFLGINSPPQWAIDAGKHIMNGLGIGMEQAQAKSKAAAIAYQKTIAASVGGKAGAGVQRWKNIVLQALGMEGLSPSLVGNVLYQMQTESGGDPAAINLSDINAQNGDPSRGLMQVIGSTFAAFHWPGSSGNIYDPMANILAALNYARFRYGPTLMSGGMGIGSGHGYALGGPITEPVIGWGVNSGDRYTFAEKGAEWVTPGKGPPSGGGAKLADSISLMMPEGTAVASALQELTWYLQTAKMRQVLP